jgi:predicted nucleotidyltransferase
MILHKNDIIGYLHVLKPKLRDSGIEKLALFGSYARNEQDQNSDIDIAIQLKRDYLQTHDVWEYFTLIETLKKDISEKFHKKSDIFDLDSTNDVKDKILNEVLYV